MENQSITLTLETRPSVGGTSAQALRRNKQIPAVIYSAGEVGRNVAVEEVEFMNIARKVKFAQVFAIKSSEPALDGQRAIVKDVQRNGLTEKLMHIDFYLLKKGNKVKVRVPLHVTGEAPGVKNFGGVLAIVNHEIDLSCMPESIPEYVEVDISSLGIGNSIHASDLKLPQGITLAAKPSLTIVSVVVSKTEQQAKADVVVAPVAVEGSPAASADAAAAAAAAGGEGAAAPAKDAAAAGAAKAAPAADKGGKK